MVILRRKVQIFWTFLQGKHTALEQTEIYKRTEAAVGKKNLNRALIVLGLLISITLLRGCYFSIVDPVKSKGRKPIPVGVLKVQKGDMPLYIKALGTVIPIDTITIKTQINGRLVKVNFKEGQFVKKGDVLVEIDPSLYEAQLKQYEGQLLKDQALLENARLDLKRYKKLYAEDSISQQVLDTQASLVKQYEGTVKSDQGLVDSVRVNLSYCKIKTDISGVVGLLQVKPGNFVQVTDTTPIATITSLDPITIIFPIPQDDLIEVQERINQNKELLVDIFDRKEEKILATGKLLAIDSQIDATTGTINLKAIVDNKEKKLYPNQFVNVRLKIDVLQDSFLVKTAAIQQGREGPYIYVLNEKEGTVSVKQIKVLADVVGESAITGDVQEGQSVVVQGIDNITEGMKVRPSELDAEPQSKVTK